MTRPNPYRRWVGAVCYQTCRGCGMEYPLTPGYWHRTSRGNQSLTSRCKPCERERALDRHEAKRQQAQANAPATIALPDTPPPIPSLADALEAL